MTVAWTIKDDYEIVSEEHSMQSKIQKNNTALEVEAMTVLDLVQAVVTNMKNANEGTLKHIQIPKQYGKR